uniref:Uncharacterized protein n=1 Tax=Brassica campestris TaxID=3711 RepID=A0A3P6BYR6_BRACM|nr:unnamed protein product [Brassica rapa]
MLPLSVSLVSTSILCVSHPMFLTHFFLTWLTLSSCLLMISLMKRLNLNRTVLSILSVWKLDGTMNSSSQHSQVNTELEIS